MVSAAKTSQILSEKKSLSSFPFRPFFYLELLFIIVVVVCEKSHSLDGCVHNWMDSYWYLYAGPSASKHTSIHFFTMDKSSTFADIPQCYQRFEPTLLCATDQEICSDIKRMLQTYSPTQQAL